jgi:hypothetical protein
MRAALDRESNRLAANVGRRPVTGRVPGIQPKLRLGQVNDPFEREADRVADQVLRMPGVGPLGACACGGTCPRCQSKQPIQTNGAARTVGSGAVLARQATGAVSENAQPIPAVVNTVLRSPGAPLDRPTRRFFDSRFGHDLSGVRVHTGTTAAQSARAVNAQAYTAGQNIVFDAGRYAPESPAGRRLLAHELTHVLQQGAVSGGSMSALALQRTPNTIDTQAQALITLAQDTTIPIDQRAQRLVTQILATYYSSDASKFTQVNWVETNPGVTAVCAATGTPTMTCTMEVGRYFVENTTNAGISRRVLQVGHEIQHVNQHRQGMGGAARRHEREFLAFHWEATAPEATGTGRMAHATRVSLIDAAIRNYNCFTAAEKTTYNTQYQQLLTLRQTEQTASGNPATPVPTQCGG